MLGFDTHADVERALGFLFKEINSAFHAFSQEMKALNVWDNVTVIQTSDFARTLNPNGGDGTDHAWGGNYMLMGRFIIILEHLQYHDDKLLFPVFLTFAFLSICRRISERSAGTRALSR